MKVCLNCRCSKQYLKKADEIKVEYRDRRALLDIVDDYPDKTIIFQIPYFVEDKENDINWDNLQLANQLLRGNFIICCFSTEIAKICNVYNIKFYFGFPLQSYYQLRAAKNLGACYARLGEGLFFDMETVKLIGVPIRAVPNVAFIDGFPRPDGVCGTWIRPEDLDTYKKYVDTIEFEDCKPTKEQALYRIYMEQKNWPGELEMIITNFNHLGLNRLILPEVAEKRLTCKQRCQSRGTCRICYRAMDLANKEDLTEYAEAMNLI